MLIYHYIYISLSDRGISPEDSEKLLVKPIEDEVKTVEGLKRNEIYRI